MNTQAIQIMHAHEQPAAGVYEVSDWREFETGGARPSLYHSFQWAELIRDVFGHQTHCLCTRRGEGDHQEITGILPLVHFRSWIFGKMLISLPFCNWGGPVASKATDAAMLAQAAEVFAKRLGVARLELRSDVVLDTQLPARKHKVRMILELPATEEEFIASLPGKVRSQTRRPLREGATATMGAANEVDRFYSVFSRNMRDLGTPVLPRYFFARLFEKFEDRAHIVTVEMNSNVVAAAVLLENNDRMEIPWASSLREANRYGVNMLLYLEAINFAIRKGFGIFDFGRSSLDSGTYRFKKQWGAHPEQLYWYTWEKQGQGAGPGLSPDNPKFGLAIRVWQKLPLWLANQAGPRLSRNLP